MMEVKARGSGSPGACGVCVRKWKKGNKFGLANLEMFRVRISL